MGEERKAEPPPAGCCSVGLKTVFNRRRTARFQSLFLNIFQFAFVGSVFLFNFMCLYGCASIPCLNLCFGECRFSICWLNFFIFFLGSRL